MREERRGLPRLDERHRRAGHLAEHRVRQADLAGRGAARGGHGGQAGAAVLRAAGHGARLRPGKQREPGRLHQAAEHGLVHAGPVPSSTRSSLPMWRPRWPPAACGARPTRSTRSSTATATRSSVTTETCDQVVPEGLANTLANALSKDDQGAAPPPGRPARSGWNLPMSGKTGTTEAHRSSGIPRLHQHAARRPTTSTTTPATPSGDLLVPAAAVRSAATCSAATSPPAPGSTAMKPIANNFGDVALPPTDPRYVDGAPGSRVPSVSGLTLGRWRVSGSRRPASRSPTRPTSVNSSASYGTVVGTSPSGQTVPGSIITIQISNGIPPAPPPPPPGAIRRVAPAICRRRSARRSSRSRAAADHRAGARSAATAASTAAADPPSRAVSGRSRCARWKSVRAGDWQ